MTNLVVIDCHDLGQHLGCYGQSSVSSDNIDKLAQDGVRFERSFCTAPQCSPSRATLYTGRYAQSNGMFGLAHAPFSWRLNDDEVYLAKYLLDAGYTTAHVGIQHVTEFTEEAVIELGFQHVLDGHLAPDVARSAVQFIQQKHDKPFFLNVGFFEPHRDDKGGFDVAPPDNARGTNIPPYLPDTPEAQQEIGALQGMIKQMDAGVGKIVDALRQANLLNDTWIIFTTDHGLALPRAKCTMYDAGVSVALIMLAPSLGIQGGQVIPHLISHVDMVPTILDGLEIVLPDAQRERLQGRSYWGLLQKHAYEPRTEIFAGKTYHTAYEPQRMIRTEHYKLIWNAEVDIINVPADIMHSPIYPQMIDELTLERPPIELYDLQNDPNEKTNLADDEAYHEILEMLRKQLLAWLKETHDPILDGAIASPYNARAIQQLKGEPPDAV
jgi:N-sulfoglucosamine sulfohydrolase